MGKKKISKVNFDEENLEKNKRITKNIKDNLMDEEKTPYPKEYSSESESGNLKK